ncbi:MAG: PEP-CTERM sorting domain-containing protein [Phycisphaerae bacterium]|nr:PEP-CTERM sorting domain-containing protein [Phycisphaerae bacterium]
MAVERSIVMIFVGVLALGGGANAQPRMVDFLPGEFIDIVADGSGTALNIGEEEERVFTTTISNALFPAGDIAIANNGGVGFDIDYPPVPDLAGLNDPLPSSNAFGGGQALLAFWDDIGNTMGDVYVRQTPGDRLIIQWHDRRFADTAEEDQISRFQIQVFDGSPADGISAQFFYNDIEKERAGGGVSATIGYQGGATRADDFQWSFNTPNAVANGTVLSLIPEPSTLLLVAAGGWLILRRR